MKKYQYVWLSLSLMTVVACGCTERAAQRNMLFGDGDPALATQKDMSEVKKDIADIKKSVEEIKESVKR